MSLAGLYYHLSALKQAGIVEVASFREVKGGTPEKVWRLKTRRIIMEHSGAMRCPRQGLTVLAAVVAGSF